MTDEPEPLLTLGEAAAALGLTPLRLRQLADRNVLRPVARRRWRNDWRFSRAEVERVRSGVVWLEQQRERHASARARRQGPGNEMGA
jgi:hypothetical protein